MNDKALQSHELPTFLLRLREMGISDVRLLAAIERTDRRRYRDDRRPSTDSVAHGQQRCEPPADEAQPETHEERERRHRDRPGGQKESARPDGDQVGPVQAGSQQDDPSRQHDLHDVVYTCWVHRLMFASGGECPFPVEPTCCVSQQGTSLCAFTSHVRETEKGKQ